MDRKQSLSIVVPTLNEAANIQPLLERTDASLQSYGIDYEMLIIDDHSSDDTVRTVERLSHRFPVRAILKRGKRGKAYSLLEGFQETKHHLIAMIDADLQYAPEELPKMYKLLTDNNADVVVTKREEQQTSPIRKLSTKTFNLIFARLLFGIKYDTQSGLKLFRKKVLKNVDMTPSPWSFDLEFIVRALENKFKIISHDIMFENRIAGVTKVKLLNTTFELIAASLKLRLRTSFRKLRAGYQANDIFLKRAFPVVITALVLSILFSAHVPSQVQALGLAADVTSPASQIVDPVVQALPVSQPTAATNDSSPTDTEPTDMPVMMVVMPLVNAAVASPSTDQSLMAAPDELQPSAMSTTPTATPAIKVTTPVGLGASTSPQSGIALDSASFSAVTAGDSGGIYGAGYSSPSSRTVHFLHELTIVGVTLGGIILIAAVALLTTSGYRNFKSQVA